MAGNSVPAFFGSKARTLKPVALDVTFVCDRSGSAAPFLQFISSLTTIQALEQALVTEGVGVAQDNRYSITSGAGGIDPPLPAFETLAKIEFFPNVDGISQRWAPGSSITSGTVGWPVLQPTAGNNTEDVALASYLVATGSRDYQANSKRIIVAAGDLQTPYLEDVVDNSVALSSLTDPATEQIYVGVHNVDITITEPAGPNPVPAGEIFGFVYNGPTTGTAIYLSNNILTYRESVPFSQVALEFAGIRWRYYPQPGQAEEILDFPLQTNGALYRLELSNTFAGTEALGTSLGQVLGRFLYETES